MRCADAGVLRLDPGAGVVYYFSCINENEGRKGRTTATRRTCLGIEWGWGSGFWRMVRSSSPALPRGGGFIPNSITMSIKLSLSTRGPA